MPNSAQNELLDSLFGKEGDYFTIIQDQDKNVLDLGTKILYLERAISQNCQDFLQSLDKLYDPNLDDEAKAANIEVIRALKFINDCCFNNQVKYDEYGTKAALDHFFGSHGDIVPIDFQTAIQKNINQRIAELEAKDPEQIPFIKFMKSARAAAEANIVGETGWRVELDLPEAQRQVRQAGVDVIQVLNGALTDEQYQQLSDDVRWVIANNPDATREIIQRCGATFANIQALPAHKLLQLLNRLDDIEMLTIAHIDFADLLALDPDMLAELLDNSYAASSTLSYVSLADFLALDPARRAVLFDSPFGHQLLIYVPLADFLALPLDIHSELIAQSHNVVKLLPSVPLADLLALEPAVRSELFNHSTAVARLLYSVPLADLLALEPAVRSELFNHSTAVARLLYSVPLADLLALEPAVRSELFNHPDAAHILIKMARIPLANLLALPLDIRSELFKHSIAVAQLVNDMPIPLADLLALGPAVRSELFNHPNAATILVNKVRIPLADLFALDQAVRLELFNRPDAVDTIVNSMHVPFETLAGLSDSQLRTVFASPRAGEAVDLLKLAEIDYYRGP